MLDCVLISEDDAFRRQVTELVGRAESNARLVLDLPSTADRLSRESVAGITEARPRLAFVDLGPGTTGLRVVRALRDEIPDLSILVTGAALPAEGLLEVMRAGATEYLPRPLADADVADAFQRLRKRVGAGSGGGDAQGRVISLYSCKGGTGVTTLAVNLAVVAASRTGNPTLLIDLNTGFGTAELHLGLQPRYSYVDVIRNFHRLDVELLESLLQDHESGVSFLAAPPVEEDDRPTGEQIAELLRICRRHFSTVIVDGGSRLSDLTMHALRASDELLVVATPEIPTLRNLKRAQNHLRVRGVPGADGARIVLNQAREDSGVTPREVREVLGAEVFASVDRDDVAVPDSLSTATPIGDIGRSRFARGLARLGDGLLGTNGRRNGSRLSFLLPFRSSSK